MAGKIFINYRRGDDPGFTQALYLRLEDEFTATDLFMDVEGYIKPGDDFVTVLNPQVVACDVMLAVIGPRWSNLRQRWRRGQHAPRPSAQPPKQHVWKQKHKPQPARRQLRNAVGHKLPQGFPQKKSAKRRSLQTGRSSRTGTMSRTCAIISRASRVVRPSITRSPSSIGFSGSHLAQRRTSHNSERTSMSSRKGRTRHEPRRKATQSGATPSGGDGGMGCRGREHR
jgi:hypothetical protein